MNSIELSNLFKMKIRVKRVSGLLRDEYNFGRLRCKIEKEVKREKNYGEDCGKHKGKG